MKKEFTNERIELKSFKIQEDADMEQYKQEFIEFTITSVWNLL